MVYVRYQPMVADARRRGSFWRLLLGLATVAAVCLVWMAGVLWLLDAWSAHSVRLLAMGFLSAPLVTLAFLVLITGLGLGTWIAARVWQKRNLRSLMGRGAVVLRHFMVACCVTLVVAGVLSLIALPFSAPILPNMALGTWLLWLPLALVAVAFQTGSEELLFRGYLQSQLAARFQHPAIWLVVPSLLFGAAHFLPSLPLSSGLVYVGFAALFGIVAGDLTARTGSIGAAWGVHFANNSMAILVVATDGSLTGLGLYRSGNVIEALELSPLLLIELFALALVWFLIRRLFTD